MPLRRDVTGDATAAKMVEVSQKKLGDFANSGESAISGKDKNPRAVYN